LRATAAALDDALAAVTRYFPDRRLVVLNTENRGGETRIRGVLRDR